MEPSVANTPLTRHQKLHKLAKKVVQNSNFGLSKMGLRLPSVGAFEEGAFLGPSDLGVVADHYVPGVPQKFAICASFMATEKEFENQPKITQMRDKLVEEYTGTVFRDKVYPNPGPRGRYGVAYIPLKKDAVPKWSRPYPLQGEKLEAYKKIVEDWIAQDLIERPKGGGTVL